MSDTIVLSPPGRPAAALKAKWKAKKPQPQPQDDRQRVSLNAKISRDANANDCSDVDVDVSPEGKPAAALRVKRRKRKRVKGTSSPLDTLAAGESEQHVKKRKYVADGDVESSAPEKKKKQTIARSSDAAVAAAATRDKHIVVSAIGKPATSLRERVKGSIGQAKATAASVAANAPSGDSPVATGDKSPNASASATKNPCPKERKSIALEAQSGDKSPDVIPSAIDERASKEQKFGVLEARCSDNAGDKSADITAERAPKKQKSDVLEAPSPELPSVAAATVGPVSGGAKKRDVWIPSFRRLNDRQENAVRISTDMFEIEDSQPEVGNEQKRDVRIESQGATRNEGSSGSTAANRAISFKNHVRPAGPTEPQSETIGTPSATGSVVPEKPQKQDVRTTRPNKPQKGSQDLPIMINTPPPEDFAVPSESQNQEVQKPVTIRPQGPKRSNISAGSMANPTIQKQDARKTCPTKPPADTIKKTTIATTNTTPAAQRRKQYQRGVRIINRIQKKGGYFASPLRSNAFTNKYNFKTRESRRVTAKHRPHQDSPIQCCPACKFRRSGPSQNPIIRCGNKNCVIKLYHKKCVGRDNEEKYRSDEGWECGSCRMKGMKKKGLPVKRGAAGSIATYWISTM